MSTQTTLYEVMTYQQALIDLLDEHNGGFIDVKLSKQKTILISCNKPGCYIDYNIKLVHCSDERGSTVVKVGSSHAPPTDEHGRLMTYADLTEAITGWLKVKAAAVANRHRTQLDIERRKRVGI